MNNIRLKKVSSNLKGRLYLSGSKSISNRVLIISELSDDKQDSIEFKNISKADDTQRLLHYLAQISSCSKQNLPLIINAENAGTVMRFLASFLSIKKGNWLLTGSKRMQHRTIGILVSALHELNAKISYAEKDGYTPLRI